MEDKKPMLEKLTDNYNWRLDMGNGGGGVGFYREINEVIKSTYKFPNGEYILMRKTDSFFLWIYKPIKKVDE